MTTSKVTAAAAVHARFMKEAINQAVNGMKKGEGGPFGAVIVKNGKIVGRGNNSVTSTNDPTAHAEVVAIRDACKNLGSFQLDGCIIYSSCEPCPMCLGAIYWSRPDKLYFAASRHDAAKVGFDDEFLYKEVATPLKDRRIETNQILATEGELPFKLWTEKADKTEY